MSDAKPKTVRVMKRLLFTMPIQIPGVGVATSSFANRQDSDWRGFTATHTGKFWVLVNESSGHGLKVPEAMVVEQFRDEKVTG